MIRRRYRRFLREEDGVSMVEAMLSLPIVMAIVMAMVEFGVLLFQWNQSVKAVQIGARLAAVSSPLPAGTAMNALTADYTGDQGDAVPTAIVAVSCGAGTTACDTAAMNRLLTGGDGTCGASTVGAPVGICDVAPFIDEDNIRVTYFRAGQGYIGRPYGPVLTIKVELRDMKFDFLFLDALIPALEDIDFPPHSVTISSEDLNDCEDACP